MTVPPGRTALSGRRARSSLALLAATLLLAGCAAESPATGTSSPAEPSTTAEPSSADPALAEACAEFWGDPDYRSPQSRVVLDRAATAPQAGPSDPFFYAITGDDIDATFEQATGEAQDAVAALSDWFRTEPEKGAEADVESFQEVWRGLAGVCASSSAAAAWTLEAGDDGTKPAALVCADVFDTPGTLTRFANANVLTSNMFKLVGRSPQTVPSDRMEDVQATDDLLAAEIAAVDDAGVRGALTAVRAPFQDALEGDTSSDGLQEPLEGLGAACNAAGYSSPDSGEIDNGDPAAEDEGLV
ncbi:hypothetical protein ACTXKL_09120 [Brachybacterium tyrofermentans]|uniref:hypothetical protein n=1 Tax=Brachybacterium tyrofermentans TaxID=47848 RepID=UPI003FD4BA9F